MNGSDLSILHKEKWYRIRFMNGLIEQIKIDHAQFIRLSDKYDGGLMSLSEDALKSMSWLRIELKLFKDLRQMGIEGVTCPEINLIEKDLSLF